MTGRELIIYILQNNLEDEEVFKDGTLIGFMDEYQAAAKFRVGVSTIRTWHEYGVLIGTKFGNHLYFLKDAKDPRTVIEQ